MVAASQHMQQFTAHASEFYSYTGLTAFFGVKPAWRTGNAHPAGLPPPLPPPKWKVGFVVWVAACCWSWLLEFSTVSGFLASATAYPSTSNARAAFQIVVTSIALLPVFFLWTPLLLSLPLVDRWMHRPWRPPACLASPECEASLCAALRWLLY